MRLECIQQNTVDCGWYDHRLILAELLFRENPEEQQQIEFTTRIILLKFEHHDI
jgi:hypothetical protein